MKVFLTRDGVRVPRFLFALIIAMVVAVLTFTVLPGDALADEIESSEVDPDFDQVDEDAEGNQGDSGEVVSRPDRVSAAVTARVLKKRVLIDSETTETDQVFANPDGSLAVESFADPARVQQEDGSWADIDMALVETGDGFSPKVAPVTAVYSGGGDDTFAKLIDVRGKDLAWGWPEELPAPEVVDNTLTYRDVVENGDLVVTALPGGFSHSIILRGPPEDSEEPLQIPIPVDLDGATMTADPDGAIDVSVGTRELVSAPAPMMWDAADDEVGDPANVVAVGAEVEKSGSATELVLTPDADLLNDPNTQYPVTIDPSYVAYSPGSVWVQTGGSSTNAYTSSPELRVGTYNGGGLKARSFVKFANGAGSWAGGQIVSAKLRLRNSSSFECENSSVSVNRITAAWSGNDVTWANQPSVTTSNQVDKLTAPYGGPSGCSSEGFHEWNIKNIVQLWATNPGAYNFGLRLKAVNETYNGSWRKYRSTYYTGGSNASQPRIDIVVNGAPGMAQAPTGAVGRTWDDSLYVLSTTPTWTSTATDGEASQVRYTIETRTSASATTVAATCDTALVASGGSASCKSTTALNNGQTYVTRARATDSLGLVGPWSSWRGFTIDSTTPAVPTMTCSGVADKNWYETKPASSTTCSVSGNGAELEYVLNGKSQTALSTTDTTGSISLPDTGYTNIKVRSRTRAGAVSVWRQVAFGTGPASLFAPIEDDRSSSTFPVEAAAPVGADSAKVQWRFAPETGDPGTWTDATSVKLASDDTTAWDGSVSGTDWSKTPKLVWNPKNETGISSTALVEVRVLFAYDGAGKASPLQRVQVVPHAFGGSFPTDSAGPGQVALFTGEFQMDTTDVDVPGYGGSLSLGRSHLSFANTASGQAGVFGPGWKSDIAGPDEGQASLIPLDRTGIDGTFVLNSPEGESYVYQHDSKKSDALATGTYTGVGETAMDEDELTLATTTDAGLTHRLTLTEWDGTRTIWARTTGGVWALERVIGVADESTTTFARDTDGYTSWIFAPAPSGVNCDATSQQPGCRALHLNYTGSDAAKRLDSVDLRIWNPNTGTDGLPGSGAGMDTITVAKYSYDGAGLLTAAWDPRLGDGASALKTQYAYATVNSKSVVSDITEPGLTPWHFNHNSTTGKLTSVTRAQDSAVGGSAATWTVKYDIDLAASGDGLPNLSPEGTAAWGQPAEDAPVAGAAVWGPERIPGSSPSAADNEFASLSYWTKSGRVTNTGSFGAGAWQIDSQRYDNQGNTIWNLDAAGRNLALAEGSTLEETAGAADRYATLTVYNADGTRVEETYTPTHDFVLDNGEQFTGRTVTETVYDDEAAAGDMPGRPTTDVPAEGFGLAIFEKTSSTDKASPGAPGTLTDTDTTTLRYNPNVAGDGDGWELKSPTKVIVGSGADSSTTTSRFDDEGKVFETRTPQSNASTGTAAQARTTHTDYYTAGMHPTNAACSDKVAWVGEVCWTGPTGGSNVPSFTTAGYTMQLTPTRVVESHDGANRTSVTGYDTGGRPTTSSVTTTGSGVTSRAVASTTTAYSTTTGLITSVSNGTQSMATTYDSWGRPLTGSDGNGNTSTITYDSAGRVKTSNDGKGTYTYTYNGDDSKGKKERRGLVTKLDVGLASGTPSTFTAAYDNSGALLEQNYPGGMKATWTSDLSGAHTGLDYTQGSTEIVSYSHTIDADGRVKVANGPDSAQGYTYDSRDRLVKVADVVADQCTIRAYEFSLDSNRQKLRTYDPATDGSCQSTTATTTVTSSFNDGDQLTTGAYVYDKLGRSTTVPAGDTINAGETPGDLTAGYHANDMVATLTQTATEDGVSVTRGQDFTLDAADRVSVIQDLVSTGQVGESVNHYDGPGDSPAWTATKARVQASDPWGATTWTRNVSTIGGDLGIIQSSDGTAKIQIANLHDDIVGSVAIGTLGLESYAESTEYGAPRESAAEAGPSRYSWLGSKQRQSVGITGGLTLMGARLFNSTTGRFLSRDPVLAGNDNIYTYPADPVNLADLTGEKAECKCDNFTKKWWYFASNGPTRWGSWTTIWSASESYIRNWYKRYPVQFWRQRPHAIGSQQRFGSRYTFERRCTKGGQWQTRRVRTDWYQVRERWAINKGLFNQRFWRYKSARATYQSYYYYG